MGKKRQKNSLIEKSNKQELGQNQNTVIYQKTHNNYYDDYGKKEHTYKIIRGQKVNFITVEESAYSQSGSYRISIEFKDNKDNSIFYLTNVSHNMQGASKEMLAKISWQPETIKQDFMECADLIANSDHPNWFLYSIVSDYNELSEKLKTGTKNTPESEIETKSAPTTTDEDLFDQEGSLSEVANNHPTGIMIYDRKYPGYFLLDLSYKEGREDDAAEKILNDVLELKNAAMYKKVKENLLDMQGDPLTDKHFLKIVDKLLLKMQEQEEKTQRELNNIERELNNTKLAKVRQKIADKLGIKTKLPKPIKQVEKILSDKLLGKIKE